MFRCATTALLGLTLCYSSSAWCQNPDYVLEIADTLAVAEHPFDVPVLLSNTGGDIQGFSAGMCSDDAVLIPTGVIPGAALQGMNGGSGPEFFEATILPGGIGCGTVFSFTGAAVIHPFAGQAEAVVLSYDSFAAPPPTTEIVFCDTVGSPPLVVVVVVGGASIVPVQIDGTVEFVDGFVRGDANASGVVNIADPIYVLNHLFLQGPDICLLAMDANDDEAVNIADALYLLLYINGSGPPPEPPFPDCGPVSPALACLAFAPCE